MIVPAKEGMNQIRRKSKPWRLSLGYKLWNFIYMYNKHMKIITVVITLKKGMLVGKPVGEKWIFESFLHTSKSKEFAHNTKVRDGVFKLNEIHK